MKLAVSVLLALMVVVAAGAVSSLAQTQSGMQGTFLIVAQRGDDVEEAIEEAVSQMNFVVRPVARHRLSKTNKPYQRITISLPTNQVSITTDTRAPILTSDDGKPIKWKREDGETFDVSTKWEGNALKQTFEAEDGKRVNSYELSSDGQELTLQVTIVSEKLKQPLVYKLSYRRA